MPAGIPRAFNSIVPPPDKPSRHGATKALLGTAASDGVTAVERFRSSVDLAFAGIDRIMGPSKEGL